MLKVVDTLQVVRKFEDETKEKIVKRQNGNKTENSWKTVIDEKDTEIRPLKTKHYKQN